MTTKGGYQQTIPDWFDPRKYIELNRAEGESHLELQHRWHKALFTRRMLMKPTSSLPQGLKDECIEKLILNPLDDCGFGMKYVGNKDLLWNINSPHDQLHPYGQPTVSPTRFGQIPECIPSNTDQSITFDDLYLSSNPYPHPSAFLTINLAASDHLLKNDFRKWLSAVRDHRGWKRNFSESPEVLVEKWNSYKLIQCIDMIKLIGPAKGVRISSSKALEWAEAHGSKQTKSFRSTTLPNLLNLVLHTNASDYLA